MFTILRRRDMNSANVHDFGTPRRKRSKKKEPEQPERPGQGCMNCRFSRPALSDEDNELMLKCHRYPPVLLVLDGDVIQAYPDAAEWCGEWRADNTQI